MTDFIAIIIGWVVALVAGLFLLWAGACFVSWEYVGLLSTGGMRLGALTWTVIVTLTAGNALLERW